MESFGQFFSETLPSLVGTASAHWANAVEVLRTRIDAPLQEIGVTGMVDQTMIASLILGVSAALVVVFVVYRLFRRRGVDTASLSAMTRGLRWKGYLAAFVLVAVFGGWSVLAPLSSASVALGVVSPDGNRKTIEHLEGGIVQTIHVAEGDHVAAGTPLVTLQNVQAMARYNEVFERYRYLRAVEARLEAERAGSSAITFPQELLEDDSSASRTLLAAQSALLDSRNATFQGQVDILQRRVQQLEEQNIGIREVIASRTEQTELIGEEIANVQDLYERGLESYPRLLALKRGNAEIAVEIASSKARIAENDERIGETELQLLTLHQQALEKTNADIADIQRQLAEIQSQMPSRADTLERTIVRAPTDGVVMNVLVTTESGIVRPGEPILEIVPDNSALVIDAKIRPTDIERVHAGMEARVILTAYRQRGLPLIHGVLRSVSADSLEDSRSGENYFLAKVEVNLEDLARVEGVTLKPGMPAEVMVLDGQQTLLNYLLSPFIDSFNRSFREG